MFRSKSRSKFQTRFSAGLIPALFLMAASALQAYTPGRYSPMDFYVLQGAPGGPRGIDVLVGGEKKQSAVFRYDDKGRLVQEDFQDSEGRKQGRIKYVYEKDQLVTEISYDARDQIVARKVFSYDKNGPVSMRVFDGKDRVVLDQHFRSEGNRIIGGTEVTGSNKERFQIEYQVDRPSVLRVVREDGKEIVRVEYQYDAKGNLLRRIRVQNGTTFKCEYKYDARGRLLSFDYYVLNPMKGWRKGKSLVLNY